MHLMSLQVIVVAFAPFIGVLILIHGVAWGKRLTALTGAMLMLFGLTKMLVMVVSIEESNYGSIIGNIIQLLLSSS